MLIIEQNFGEGGGWGKSNASIETCRSRAIDKEQSDIKFFWNVVARGEDDVISVAWFVELPGCFEQLKELFDDSGLGRIGNNADHK